MGDAADVGDAVNLGDDPLQGQVPGWVDNVCKLGLGDGDVPAFNLGRGGVVGEEFHVDGICVVYVEYKC